MANPIVQVNVTQTIAPTPSVLQKSGALVSQGGTIQAPGNYSFLTQLSDLSLIQQLPLTLSALSWSAGVVTATASAVHKVTVGDQFLTTIAGAVPAGYNGTFLATATTTTEFTYALTTNPGVETTPGTYTPRNVAELVAMATTFFSQGASQGVYVLELGPGEVYAGVNYLNTWIANNSGVFYSYLTPRSWDADPSFLAFLAQFNSTTSKTYFYVTTTLATWQSYTALMKCVKAMVECPSYGAWAANVLTSIAFSGSWATNVLTAIAWANGVVTASTTTAHGVLPGEQFTISGCTPIGYNGTFVAQAGTTGSTLVYNLAVNPGTETGLGSLAASAQGTVTATTTSAHGVLPGQYFSIAGCVPTGYNGTFLAQAGTTGSTLVYYLTANPGAESTLGVLVASVYASAGIPTVEFSHAADFQHDLNYAPSTTNKVTPNAFSFVFGVTPFPTQGTGPILTALKIAAVNVIGTGAEGGISDTILLWGTTMDGNDFTYWYSVDWVQINCDLNVSNAVINGSNDPINPLYYNQDGINRLQQVIASTMASGVTFGLVLGTVTQTALDAPEFFQELDDDTFVAQAVVNAVPFVPYSEENPGDYKIGRYAGFAVVYVPARGFIAIVINVNVSQFVTA